MPGKFANAQELVTPPPKPGTAPLARTLVTVERRRDHAEAVQRLAEIAGAVNAAPTFLQIGGWPAVQRRFTAPLPLVARAGEIAGPTKIATFTTTAVAVGNLVVRLETTVAPDADQKLSGEAEAMARQLISPAPRNPLQSQQEVLKLRQGARKLIRPRIAPPAAKPPASETAVSTQALTQPTAALVTGGVGEIEVGGSNSGQNVVVATNAGVAVSSNAGASFPTFFPRGNFFPFPNFGDPSVAVGATGNFYVSYIGVPDGTAAAGGVSGCAISVGVSGNNGAAWSFGGHAAFCPMSGNPLCFTDQEHIAADRINRVSTGADQVYAVWRNFTPVTVLGIGAPSTCTGITGGAVTPSISCSRTGAGTWGAPVALGSGDHPRVTVGSDGSVYAIELDWSNIMLHKFTSCDRGFAPVAGFPVRVASINLPNCPVSGLDRCTGEGLSSPTLAADDTNPNHLYVSFAQRSASGTGDDIVVMDSLDGGLHWRSGVAVNSAVSARRFMPWVCAMGGTAYTGWYDRRASTSSTNDATDYFQGSAFLRSGVLTAGTERNLSGTPDPQCASGWPFGSDAANDSESCSTQPQIAGRCARILIGGGSGAACDLSSGPCPFGETCNTFGGGVPKYGDYNGIGCGGNRVFSAWASATAPSGVTAPGTGIRVFDDVLSLNTQLTVALQLSPTTDAGRFNVQVDGTTVLSGAGNGGKWTSQSIAAGTHTVGLTAAAGTTLSNYSVSFGGDCNQSGSVTVVTASSRVCTISIKSNTYTACTQACARDRDACMAEVATPGGPRPQQCVLEYNGCMSGCARGIAP